VLPDGVIYGLLAALGWGIADFLVARTGAAVGERTVFAVSQPLGAVLLLTIVLPGGIPVAGLLSFEVIWVGLLGALALLALYAALRRGPVAIASPIGATYGGVAALFAIALGGETLGWVALGGAGAITAGVVLVSADPRAVQSALLDGESIRPTIALAVLAAVGLGASNYLLDGIAAAVGPFAAVLGIRTVGAVVGAPFLRGLTEVPRSQIPALVAIAVFDTGAFVAFALGLQVAQVAVVTPIASLFALVTVGLGRIILDERLTPTQWSGIALVVAGTPILAA
jgi:drug/metabolite transporter (DMT)-like permease